MMDPAFKEKVFTACINFLEEKISSLKISMNDLREGAENDSKSSAGDKHETARAMMQLEQERITKQLSEFELQKESLEKINIQFKSLEIIKGSLVETDKSLLFVSVALGKLNVNGKDVIVLSPASPLGKLLSGKKKDEEIQLNAIKYRIKNVI